jgi:ATP synthase subunit 6
LFFFNKAIYLDPLEQFLLLPLYPGCPIINLDSNIFVILITVLTVIYIFSVEKINLSNFRVYKSTVKLNKVNRVTKNFLFFWTDSLYFVTSPKKILDLNLLNNCTLFLLKISNVKQSFYFIKNFVYSSLKFIYSVVRENLFLTSYPFFSIYYYSFLSILFFNVLGLLLFSFTATSSFALILNYSFSLLAGLAVLGGYLHLTLYFNQFLPEGVPLFIAPILALIELFSSIIRVFSLTVRLFANMLAGHSLLKIIISVS